MTGYGYVAWLVASEQLGQRLAPRTSADRASTPAMEADASVARAA